MSTSTRPPALTTRQHEVYSFVYEFTRENGFQPSMEMIAKHFGMAYRTGALQVVKAIEKKGYVERPACESRSLRFLLKPDGQPFTGFAEKDA